VLACKTTSLTDNGFTDMHFNIDDPPTVQNAVFTNLYATSTGDATVCNSQYVSLSPSLPFVTYNGASIVVTTTDVNVVGPHPVTMTVGLTDYPEVDPLIYSFTVTIACSIASLSFTTTQPSTEYRPGVNSEPLVIS